MSRPLRAIQVIGVHPILPTEQEFREAIALQWGEDLSGDELHRAEGQVREYFANLYLFEVEIEPADADVDWCAITQPIEGQPKANWQVPYDERRVDERENHWAFFFHFLDRSRPMQTQLGDRDLPGSTPIPPHLRSIRYEVPQ